MNHKERRKTTAGQRIKKLTWITRGLERFRGSILEWVMENSFHTEECNNLSDDDCSCGLDDILTANDEFEEMRKKFTYESK